MKDLKSILTFLIVLAIAGIALFALVANRGSFVPSQKTGTLEEATLNQDLSSLDATDLDTGIDAQLDQLSSDSSSF